MEVRINEVQYLAPTIINFEELKQALTEKTSMYETLVYTDEQIKDAKADRAELNRLKKTLNDERIRLEREYMLPFNATKANFNELIALIDKPVAAIDKQVKEYEEQQKQEKIAQVKEYFESLPKLEGFETLTFEQIYNPRWQNASCVMRAIHDEISGKLNNIKHDLVAIQNLPEFGFEAMEVYKSTLDLRRALDEAHRLSEVAKKKAEHEAEQARLAAEAEAKMQEAVQMISNAAKETAEAIGNGVIEAIKKMDEVPAKQWISFKACLTVEQAMELRQFFVSRNIKFEAI